MFPPACSGAPAIGELGAPTVGLFLVVCGLRRNQRKTASYPLQGPGIPAASIDGVNEELKMGDEESKGEEKKRRLGS
jgi:hypothetical protein